MIAAILVLALTLFSVPADTPTDAPDTAETLLDERSSTVHRMGGDTRVETAAILVNIRYPYPDQVDRILIVNGYDYPDALASANWAGRYPILFVSRSHIPAPTRSELERLEPHQIWVIGGEAAISEEVEVQLERYLVVDRNG